MGRYVVTCIYYPYQNSMQRESLDRSLNHKFGQEFAHFLDSFNYSL